MRPGLPTTPGIDINVTPEMEAPIMPNATRYHLLFLDARKKLELSLFFPVIHAMTSSKIKYITMTVIMVNEEMLPIYLFELNAAKILLKSIFSDLQACLLLNITKNIIFVKEKQYLCSKDCII